MSHKFKLGQPVRLARPSFSGLKTGGSGLHEIVRLMPADQTGEVSYRVREVGGGTERAVRESELSAGAS